MTLFVCYSIFSDEHIFTLLALTVICLLVSPSKDQNDHYTLHRLQSRDGLVLNPSNDIFNEASVRACEVVNKHASNDVMTQ